MEKVIKRIATAIVLLLCAMIVLRSCMSGDKSTFSKPYASDALKTAFSDGESSVIAVKVEREISEDGYFSAYGFYYNPESGEVQVAVRWNKSVYEYTDMTEGHEFSFHLLNETTGETYPCTAVEEKQVAMYSYRRLIAAGVSVADDEQLTVVMELRDGFESTQIIKFAEQTFEEYKLSSSLKKELGIK